MLIELENKTTGNGRQNKVGEERGVTVWLEEIHKNHNHSLDTHALQIATL